MKKLMIILLALTSLNVNAQCPAPRCVEVGKVTTEYIELYWLTGKNESEWQIVYSATQIGIFNDTIDVHTAYYRFPSDSGVHYQIKIRTKCFDGGYSEFTPINGPDGEVGIGYGWIRRDKEQLPQKQRTGLIINIYEKDGKFVCSATSFIEAEKYLNKDRYIVTSTY